MELRRQKKARSDLRVTMREFLVNEWGAKKEDFLLRPGKGRQDSKIPSIEAINGGVALLVILWDIGGGSGGNKDLYKLLQGYLLDPDVRESINRVLENHEELQRQRKIG